MLKHCSASCVDVSRRSLRHSSLTLDRVMTDTDSGLSSGPGLGHGGQLYRQAQPGLCVSLYTIPSHGPASSVDGSDTSSEAEADRDSSFGPASPASSHGSSPRVSNTIRVYATCLRPHLAYKTIMITAHTTSREVITSLLTRFRMRHRDHKLYYLTMEVTVNSVLQTITLEDNSRPAELISCNPWGACKFILRSKTGGRVKIYDDQIRTDSVYKSIIISRETTVSDTLEILLSCYNNLLDNQNIALYETNTRTGAERLLESDQCPLLVTEEWTKEARDTSGGGGEPGERRFVVRFRPGVKSSESVGPVTGAGELTQGDTRDRPPGGFIIVKRNNFLRQSVRKKNFLRSMICVTGALKAVDINIDSDSLGDTETESEASELNTSEEEDTSPRTRHAKSDPMEYSEEDESLVDSSVILESFFT